MDGSIGKCMEMWGVFRVGDDSCNSNALQAMCQSLGASLEANVLWRRAAVALKRCYAPGGIVRCMSYDVFD